VNAEFDRVAKAFEQVSGKQSGQDQIETGIVMSILEEKRTEVMARSDAGYFIRDWQDLKDQVRQLIAKDSRYQALKAQKEARRA